MPYISTRDARNPPERLAFDAVLLAGLAPDGGLFVPTAWPPFAPADLAALKGKSYAEIAARVTALYLDGVIGPRDWQAMVADAYR